MKVINKLFLLSVLPFILIVFAIILISRDRMDFILRQKTDEHATHDLDFHAAQVATFFERKVDTLSLIASTPVVQSGNIPHILKYLRGQQDRVADRFEGFYYNDADGTVYDVDGNTFSVRNRYYFPQIARGEVVITKIITSRATQQPIVLVLVPIFSSSQGNRTGAIGGTVLVKDLLHTIQNIKIGRNGFAIMVDQDAGVISGLGKSRNQRQELLIHPEEKKDLAPGATRLPDVMLSQEAGSTRVTYKDSYYRVYFKKIPVMQWSLALLYDETESFFEPHQFQTFYILFGTIGFLAVLFFLFGINRIVLKPIRELMNVQGDFGQGKLSSRSSNTSLDEFGSLSRSFNQMADQLCERTTRIEEEVRERKHAEQKILEEKQFTDTALDSQLDTFFLFEPETGKALRWNRAFRTISGYSDAEIAANPAPESYYSPEDIARANAFTEKILKLETGTIELDLICKDGSTVPTEYRVSVVKDGNGVPRYIISIGRDIRERKQAELEKQQLEAQILQNQKLESVGTLAGGIAHDFNNFLSVIIGNASLAESLFSANKQFMKHISAILIGAEQAKNLTQQLLTFARGGAPVIKAVDINSLIHESAEFVLRGARVKCQFELSENIWSVKADKGQISQVISNLVINANQAMPDGGQIIIRTENIERIENENLPLVDGKYVKITVEDQGCGIPEKNLANIFDPYFTTKATGSGLGLATVFSIIKRHSGEIRVRSQEGKGTIFSIFLPASQMSPAQAQESPPLLHRGRGRVLIMDDEKDILEMAASMLEKLGYATEQATDGSDAVAMYQKALGTDSPFNLVILDLTVPGGMGGANAMTELAKIDPQVKVIVCSGYHHDPILSHYKDYGFIGMIPKPYRMNDMAKVLRDVFADGSVLTESDS